MCEYCVIGSETVVVAAWAVVADKPTEVAIPAAPASAAANDCLKRMVLPSGSSVALFSSEREMESTTRHRQIPLIRGRPPVAILRQMLQAWHKHQFPQFKAE
jgi:hypothetical protein